MVETSGQRYQIRAVSRALQVLSAVARAPHGGADLSYLARETAIHPSTVFRLAETLVADDFLRPRESGGYEIGPKAFEIGSAFLRGVSIWSQAQELVESLAGRVNETASIGVLDGQDVLYVAIAHGQEQLGIQSYPGTRHPAYCTALGKVLLAAMPWSQAEEILRRTDLVALTSHTLTSVSELRSELQRAAEQGFALDDTERSDDIRCVAAPIRDHTGHVVAAISASGPAFRLHGATLGAVQGDVMTVAETASRRLGGGTETQRHAVLSRGSARS